MKHRCSMDRVVGLSIDMKRTSRATNGWERRGEREGRGRSTLSLINTDHTVDRTALLKHLLGGVRFPRNLIRGVLCCAAAACRRIEVALIATTASGRCVMGLMVR